MRTSRRHPSFSLLHWPRPGLFPSGLAGSRLAGYQKEKEIERDVEPLASLHPALA
jgi:hypothetical protein